MTQPLHVHFLGTLRSPTSWAHVTREMILALDGRGHDVSVTNCRGFLHDGGFGIPTGVKSLLDKPRRSQFEIAFDYPPNYHKLKGERRVGMLVYETTALPIHWRDAILTYLHLLLTPSQFCKRIMVSAGIADEVVEVVPYGVRPELFRPNVPAANLPTRKRFKFLCVAMPHKRKAVDALLEAYCSEFSARDDVCLVIKSSYQARPGRLRPWETELEPMIADFSSRPQAPEIVYICKPFPIEAMSHLYAACDCYVQPSRSEGFGLAILEAFACSRPAIVTGWSGYMDFCDESNSYLLNYELVRAREIQYDNDSTDAVIAQPDTNHLRFLMRSAYEDSTTLQEKSEAARATAAKFTWAAAAEKTEAALTRLKESI